VAQSKNYSFGVNTAIELKSVTISDNIGNWRGIFWLRCVPVFYVVDIFFELSRSINTKWSFLRCASIAFSKRYVWYVDSAVEKTPTEFKPNLFDLKPLISQYNSYRPYLQSLVYLFFPVGFCDIPEQGIHMNLRYIPLPFSLIDIADVE